MLIILCACNMKVLVQFLLLIYVFVRRTDAVRIKETWCYNEGEKILLSDTCKHYLECHNGFYVQKSCGFGETYDLNLDSCAWSGLFSSACNRECNFKYNKPVGGSNTKYIYCENGTIKQGNCNGYFDRIKKLCRNKVEETNTDYKTFAEFISNELASCTPGDKKLVEGSCADYLECNSTSQWISKQCEDCKNFEPVNKTCVWSWKYYCNNDTSPTAKPVTSSKKPSSSSTMHTSTQAIPTDTPTASTVKTTKPTVEPSTSTVGPTTSTLQPKTSTGQPTSTVSTVKPSTSTVGPTTSSTLQPTTSTGLPTSTVSTTQIPQCTNNQMKIYKKGDCKDYLQCESGKWVKKTCSWGEDFDINKLECRISWLATC